MAGGKSKIIYTLTDEAAMLATCAFLPIIRTFTGPAGIEVEKADISVSARVIAEFPECLTEEQRLPNTLGELGKKCLVGNDMQSAMGGVYPAPGITIGPGLVFAFIAARDAVARARG